MQGTLPINGKRCRYRPPPVKDKGVMAIRTGLSATVAGYLIRIDRDEYQRVARVVVEPLPNTDPNGKEAVKVAAQLLAERAQRFLGAGWRVVPWNGKTK